MGIVQGRKLEWVAMPSFSIAGGFFTFGATRDAQEYWSGKPIPSPGDLPNPGIEARSPTLQEPAWKPKNTGVGSLSLFQQIFPTQEWNWGLLHCTLILYLLSYQGSPI